MLGHQIIDGIFVGIIDGNFVGNCDGIFDGIMDGNFVRNVVLILFDGLLFVHTGEIIIFVRFVDIIHSVC